MLKYKLKQLVAEREYEQGRRITLVEIADAAGVNRATLSKMLNQKGAVVRTDVLDRLCQHFKCELGALVEHVPSAEC